MDPLPNEKEFQLESTHDRLRLSGRYWPVPNGECQAVVLIFHGSGEHGQRYRHVAKFFNQHQLTCVTFDTRGHGKSDGERGFVPHISASFEDLESVINYIHEKLHLLKPLVLYTHGTGGAIAIAHVLRQTARPLKCEFLILSTPSICLKTRPTRLLYVVTRAFSNLSPHLRLPIAGNDKNDYCDDEAIMDAYRKDKLVHDRWPARTVSLYLEIGYLLETNTVEFPMPVLLQHAKDDELTPAAFIEKWFTERVKSNKKTLKMWPTTSHELHHDLKRKEVLQFACDWILEGLKNGPTTPSTTASGT